jgi:hypothetical protein
MDLINPGVIITGGKRIGRVVARQPAAAARSGAVRGSKPGGGHGGRRQAQRRRVTVAADVESRRLPPW